MTTARIDQEDRSTIPGDAGGLRRRPLSREECLGRLRLGTVARLARTEGALPRIEVVRYCLIGDTIVIDAGSDALAAKLAGHVVALESGATSADGPGDAWSVCVIGAVARSQGLLGDGTVLEMHPSLVHGWVDTRWAPESPSLA
jgi:Pyridoxamine 5'-phosphate oxidase